MPAIRTERHKYQCFVSGCDSSFTKRCDLVRHSKLHSKNKEDFLHRCEIAGCDYATLQKSNLKTHKGAVHDGEKRFICPYKTVDTDDDVVPCPFRTADPGSLTRHRKQMHGYKPEPVRSSPRRSKKSTKADKSVSCGDDVDDHVLLVERDAEGSILPHTFTSISVPTPIAKLKATQHSQVQEASGSAIHPVKDLSLVPGDRALLQSDHFPFLLSGPSTTSPSVGLPSFDVLSASLDILLSSLAPEHSHHPDSPSAQSLFDGQSAWNVSPVNLPRRPIRTPSLMMYLRAWVMMALQAFSEMGGPLALEF